MENLEQAKSVLQLKRLQVSKLRFNRFDVNLERIDPQSPISFSHSLEQLGRDQYIVKLGVTLLDDKKYDIEVEMSGIFEISIKSEFEEKMLAKNTTAILFPYLRSQLTLLSSQPGFEPIILPVININALINKDAHTD